MRVYLLYFVLLVVCFVGFRNWYQALCASIVMVAFIERQDMPQSIVGIPGLNPFNLLLAVVLFQWAMQRHQEGIKWDMQILPMFLISAYLLMISIGFLRAAIDVTAFQGQSTSISELFIDELVNPMRYLIPALLVFDGCRSRKRLLLTITAILTMGVIVSFFVIRYIPFGTLTGSVDILASRNRLDRELGFHANDVAFLQVFIFWAAVFARPLFEKLWQKILLLGGSFMVLISVGLCQSRGGFLGLILIAAIFSAIRKPFLLLFLFAVLLIIPTIFPGIVANLSRGVNDGNDLVMNESQMNWDEITSGRMTNLWPHAWEFIKQSPTLGYGRYAILRVPSLFSQILESEGRVPVHPHNAYFEILLDYGAIGLTVVLFLFFYIMYISIKLMKDSDKLLTCVGAIAFVGVLDNFVIGISSRALLPRPTAIVIWCAFALALRLWQMRSEYSDLPEEEGAPGA